MTKKLILQQSSFLWDSARHLSVSFWNFRSVKINGDFVVSAGNLICVYSMSKQVKISGSEFFLYI